MNNKGDQTVFVTLVRTIRDRLCARLLIDSIRSFGGTMSDCPIWLFEADPHNVPCDGLDNARVQVLPLTVPDTVRNYEYADKVYACVRAEELATAGLKSLIYLATECLIVKPPLLFDLAESFDVAVRPVHIVNVGLPVAEPVDDFWKKVYETVGVHDLRATVESFVDVQNVRAYFNSAAFAIDPSKGLFRRWFECFEALVRDSEFQAGPCQDERHRIFLHQAVLSTLMATLLDPKRIRVLPPDYGYPYNLHPSVPLDRRASALNDLVHVIYHDRSIDPSVIDDIEVHEPLRSWLSARAKGI
jgi:hypothetical protein